jgi:hypothetical protein
MYFLLTGEEPLALQTSSPRDLNPEVSLHTDMIVKRATAQDLLLRYQSAQEMKHDLEEWKKEKKEKNPVLKAVAITLGIVTALGIFGAGATFVGNLIEDKNRAEQESKQIELREQELKKKAAALQEIAQRQQGKLTDDISTHAAPSRPQDPQQPKQATVAFREVDEQELTDPDDAVGQRDPLTPPPIAPQSEPTADVIPKPAPKRRMKPPAAAPAPVNLPPIPMAAPYAKSTSTADEFDSPENQ